MAINLQKGQKIDIGLSKMTVGLGWTPNEGTGYVFDPGRIGNYDRCGQVCAAG